MKHVILLRKHDCALKCTWSNILLYGTIMSSGVFNYHELKIIENNKKTSSRRELIELEPTHFACDNLQWQNKKSQSPSDIFDQLDMRLTYRERESVEATCRGLEGESFLLNCLLAICIKCADCHWQYTYVFFVNTVIIWNILISVQLKKKIRYCQHGQFIKKVSLMKFRYHRQ